MKQVISLGGGVQSSVLCLMAAEGLIGPMPEAAVFADTGHEPQAVMDYIDFLSERLPFPLVKVKYRDLGADTLGKVHGVHTSGGSPPLFVRRPNGKQGMLPRQCTRDYKVRPVQMWVKENILGLSRRGRWPKEPMVQVWLGITTDEMERMKASGRVACENRFPFIDDVNMSRTDCLTWAARRNLPQPPKSACYFCPYAAPARWAWMKVNDPDSWDRAVEFDHKLREVPRSDGELFLHRACLPLDQVNLPEPDDSDDRSFLGECDGMCGV